VTLAAAALLATGCGSDDGNGAAAPASPTKTSADSGGLPACDTIWVDGQTLPQHYRGCVLDGKTVISERHRCEYGTGIVEYDGRFYAVPGNRINETADLDSSAAFKKALGSCQG
jgi:hypothetical protein